MNESMKNLNALLHVFAACLLCALALAAPARAATLSGSSLDEDTEGVINVSNIEAGVSLTAYKVATVNFDYDVDQPVDPQYLWVGALETEKTYVSGMSVAQWVYQNYPDYIGYTTSGDVTDVTVTEITEAFAGEDYEESDDPTGETGGITASELAGFYDDLAAAIRSGTVVVADDGDDIYTATADEEGTASLTVSQGVYLLITDNGVEYVHKVSSVNVVPTYNSETGQWELTETEMEVKRTPLSIDKEITSYDDVEGEEFDGTSAIDSSGVGDTVSYRIAAAVPGYPESALAHQYYITDTLPCALTLDADSIRVYGAYTADADIEDMDLLTEDTDYLLSTSVTADDARTTETLDSFTVYFSYDANNDGDCTDEGECDLYDQIDQYSYIVVTYDTTMNHTALAATAYENDATLTWSNSPYVTGNYTTTSVDTYGDDPIVYTYGIELLKTNTAGDVVLQGAGFRLVDYEGNALYFFDLGDGDYELACTDWDNEYTEEHQSTSNSVLSMTVDGETATNTLVSAADGTITITGLDAGTYTLTETVAPDGYNKIGYQIEVVITDADLDGAPTLSGLYSNDAESSDGYVHITVTDTQGFELPQTGGIGTVVFTVTGLGLMVAAVCVYGRARRERRAD